MKIDEKEKILIFILSVVLLVAFYVMFLVPSMLDNIKTLQHENQELEKKIAEVKEMGNVIKDYKVLNMKTVAFLKGYFQDLNQERIILGIDDLLKLAGLENKDIIFDNDVETGDFPVALQKYPCLSANVNVIGSAAAILKHIEDIGKFNKKILISDVTLTTGNNSVDLLQGKLGLQFMAINGGQMDGSISTNTTFPSNKGNSNPFSSSSIVNIVPGVDLAKVLLDQLKGGNSDFTLTAKPYESDLPTVILGLENDRQAESYVYADNAKVENVNIRIIKKADGKYYFQYSTSEVSYPQKEDGKEIPFVTGNTQIMMKIYSDMRKNGEDQSGVALTINNETELPFVIEVKHEDAQKPRVQFKDLKGNISVYNAQGVLIQSSIAQISNDVPPSVEGEMQ